MDDIDALAPEQLRLALASADVGVFELDAESRVMTLDPRARQLVGAGASGRLTLDEYLALVDASDRARVSERLAAAVEADREPYHDEYRTSSRRWITASGRAVHGPSQRRVVVVGLLHDVTVRRTTDDARARLIDEMARSLRFNDMLIGMVAHDLRAPLDAVAAEAKMIAEHGPDERVRVGTSRIGESAGRMSRIVEQLLDLTHARLDGQLPLRTAPSDLVPIARQVSAEAMAAHAGAVITIDAAGDTTCVCDGDRVAQVLSNLVANAVQHGTDDQTIRIFVDGARPDVLRVTVANAGAIAPELAPTMFNPFRRLRGDHRNADRRHGLGLGLYIARRIVMGHGGEITVTTLEDQETTFCAELPRTATSTTFSLTPEQGEEEAISLQSLGIAEPPTGVTAALFGVLPLHERAPEAFASLVERHARLLDMSLDRQIFRGVGPGLGAQLRELAEHLGTMGAGAHDVAELHSRALKAALKGAPALKAQSLVAEGRMLALELMGRLLTFYRKRSGFGALRR